MSRSKNPIHSLVEILARKADFYLTPEKVRALIEANLEGFQRISDPSGYVQRDIEQIGANLLELGWMKKRFIFDSPPNHASARVGNNLDDGVKNLQKESIISRGIVKAGWWRYLDDIDRNRQEDRRGMVAEHMEKLLRHVEVRRERSLQNFDPVLSGEAIWFERLAICILFSRHARRSCDLRFLNTSLKMNDWYYARYKNRRLDAEKVRYILSLSEQECCAAELLA